MSKKHKKEHAETPAAEEAAPQAAPEAAAEAGAPAEPALEEQLAAAREEAQKNWDLYLRQRADLENFRKRAQRDKEDTARFANEGILREMLPVLDNLERAVEHARQEEASGNGLLQGVEMTVSQFQKALEKFGVKPVQALGQPFDPAVHEAIGQIESADQPANTVVQELQKGYLLNDRLLRPAMVMLAKAPAAGQEEAAGND
ncbi:hypothetical protein DESUT3_40460 [Desulfuromonas versatilis]|uniref:Protein GrpE n=1 Tax=Desulfuromonas versatilis TaxID=2802975 RepID=A0ABM8I2D2_9BACT|nr:nucleotide exchange factor GrpE [Desulfuromonas versatilis]BCR06977.1 hypothetical protein DESUT3_40460 [Desulfuromonas versatilis]